MRETTPGRWPSRSRRAEAAVEDRPPRPDGPAPAVRAGTETDPGGRPGPGGGRLVSLDALRGFDMFWLIGGAGVAQALLARSGDPRVRALGDQFKHVKWEGFHFLDLIFPLFLFLIGAAIPFSFARRLERGGRKVELYAHIMRRVAILVVLGMMVNGNLLSYDPSRFQITYSVLQMLALGYLVASLLYLNLTVRWQVAATAALLVGYWALMTFVPVPGHVVGVYRPGANFGDWLNDRILGDLQGRWRLGWILGIMTHSSTAMLGVFAGQVLRGPLPPRAKWAALMALGVGCTAAGLLWAPWFPIIKERWTSSYALFTGGLSYLLLAASYLVIDVWGYRRWAFPLVVIGMNSIAAYMLESLFQPTARKAAEVFVAGLKPYVGPWYPAVVAAGSLGVLWLVLYWMYRTKTFVRV